uniref:Uncharacterized protein n=1 Tax=viral metagenome TaxID=1070528 RepID=A0A6M3JBV1_9ZZZZ
MKILILVVVTLWSFGSPYPNPQKMIVNSPEEAAIIIRKFSESQRKMAEPDRYSYTLYEIDTEDATVKEIKIPRISFSSDKKD